MRAYLWTTGVLFMFVLIEAVIEKDYPQFDLGDHYYHEAKIICLTALILWSAYLLFR
jgi:hypothetical protein